MDRLFLSFSQVDSSTTRRYGGTGLGLAICRRLSELMGGTMWAESSGLPGEGAVFHITMQAPTAREQLRPLVRDHQPNLVGKRVLVVDDSVTTCRILSAHVAAWGMQPYTTCSPHEALSWIERGDSFELAILDLFMPEMDGIALGAAIRQRASTPPLLVMLTALGSREAGATDGFAAVLTKPLKASQLYNMLVGLFGAPDTAEPLTGSSGLSLSHKSGTTVPLRILLAEDHAINQKLALGLLARMGYRADVAANGLEAIAALQRQPYDLVFMDVQMPELDGLEATRRIVAEWPADRRPRIIAMTANALQEDRDACFAAGMDDYLSKPIRVAELQAALAHSHPLADALTPWQPATNPLSELLDLARLKELRAGQAPGEPDLVEMMLALFLEETPALLTNLRAALVGRDTNGVRRAAHALRGNSANIGANRLAEAAAALERVARHGSLADALELVEQIEHGCTQLCQAITAGEVPQ